jgi:hypothetical protein
LQLGKGEIGNLIDDFDLLCAARAPHFDAPAPILAPLRATRDAAGVRSACCSIERSCSRGGESGRSTVASS